MTRLPIALALLLLAPTALAQYQVDNRVGGELNGNNEGEGNPARFHPYQTGYLPSESRNAIVRSGALPSEITQNRFEVGPLPPNGIIDYIPRQSPLQQAARLPVPQLVNPEYGAQARLAGAQSGPTPKPGFAQSNANARSTTTTPPQSQARQVTIPGLTPVPDLALPSGGELPTGQLQPAPLQQPRPATVLVEDPAVRIGTVYYRRPTPAKPQPPTQNPVPATKPAY